MDKLLDNMIPVSAFINDHYDIWYIDIENLNLSDLFKLRNELVKNSQISIRVLDAVILKETNSYYKPPRVKNEVYRNSKISYKKRAKRR